MLNEIKDILKKYNQEQLLTFYNELGDNEKQNLLNEINSIDFELMNKLYNNIKAKKDFENITSMSSSKSIDEYNIIGSNSVKHGEYALITMAGGQGSRLGYDGPKGCYKLGYGIDKTLFEIQCDKLKKIYDDNGIYISWYIMTSRDNDKETVDFFIENNYFNYPKEKIEFFVQGELPMIDINGKILLDRKDSIKMGPNGHGGIFLALDNSGLLDKLRNANVKWIFIGGIDNILLPVDALDLIGFAIQNKFSAVSKIVTKAYPEEKVGVFCKKNGRASVIEYYAMTEEMNNRRDENNNLVFRDAHILCNMFNIDILDIIKNKPLEYTGAFKKTEYLDLNGKIIEPTSENAYKFESFLFDAFSYVDNVGLLQASREDTFAPIKNVTGADSPETASKLYIDFHNKNIPKGRDNLL